MFAAGWDAACELARAPLADSLLEQALDGVTETITRNGEVVAERHRHDSRLSIAVLHRLDKRCDLALERNSAHRLLLPRWGEWLSAVGKGDDETARAMLVGQSSQDAQHLQLPQLPLGENPIEESADEHRGGVWRDGYGDWWTDYPPPPGFDREERGNWGERDHERRCSDAETLLLDAVKDAEDSSDEAEAATERNRFFAGLAAALEPELEEPQAEEDAPNRAS